MMKRGKIIAIVMLVNHERRVQNVAVTGAETMLNVLIDFPRASGWRKYIFLCRPQIISASV